MTPRPSSAFNSRKAAPHRAERSLASGDAGGIRPALREEIFPVALAATIAVFIALIVCYTHGYLLLYGDAVAHLGIARRILDNRHPGIVQLGGVWLPLPHLLMLPFVQKMAWWQSGLAGAWPSMACYIVGVCGFYRLCRQLLTPALAFSATAFYALNANLLYLSTTAMTEPLFLALLVWSVVLTLECVGAIRAGSAPTVRVRFWWLTALLVAAVYTRYDGWILGAAIWCGLSYCLWRHPRLRRQVMPTFVTFTVLLVAAPLGWFWYNQHFSHDWLDFMRGPYSARGIEIKTTPPGAPHYRGWHNFGWSIVIFSRCAQVDAAAWETGWLLAAGALAGLWITQRARANRAILLLWLPLPFYLYSFSYGSVPIFIPQIYPHSFYNSRYGMEMLPALVLFAFLTLAALANRWSVSHPLLRRLAPPITLALAAANCIAMMYWTPLVLKEAQVNSKTRVPFEAAIGRQLLSVPPGTLIMMYTADHVGAIQQAGLPLRELVSEQDYDSWKLALANPAKAAPYIAAIAGDPVDQAVNAHPAGLTELTVLCSTGQPCLRFYHSDVYGR